MMDYQGPSPADWGLCVTKPNDEQHVITRREEGMKEKIEILKKKWETDVPDDELSLLVGTGEVVYIGRFAEGIVLRLNDDEEQITFLTVDMARALGERLISGNVARG